MVIVVRPYLSVTVIGDHSGVMDDASETRKNFFASISKKVFRLGFLRRKHRAGIGFGRICAREDGACRRAGWSAG
jgi:uncharacterized protein YfaT (DUF1175 family)